MTSPDVPVSMWCWPGSNAGFAAQHDPAGQPVLTLFLDPVNVVLSAPPFPDGPARMSGYMRQLAQEALRVAAELDEMESPPGQRPGAHRVRSLNPVRPEEGQAW